MGGMIMGMLFIGMLVYIGVTELCGALRAQGHNVPLWLSPLLTALILLAFVSVVLMPPAVGIAFQTAR